MATLPTVTSFGGRPAPYAPGPASVPQGAAEAPAQALSGLGDHIGHVGQLIEQEQNRQDTLAAEDAFNQLREKQLELTTGENGFAQKQGKDAAGSTLIPQYEQQFQDATKNLAEGLQNEHQRQLFEERAAVAGLQYKQDLLNHVMHAHAAYAQQVFKSGLQVELQNGGARWQDPNAVGLSITRSKALIQQEAQRQGWAPDAVKAAESAQVSQIHAEVIGQALAAHDTAYAKEWYAAHKDEIAPAEQVKLEGLLRTSSVRADSQQAADHIFATTPPTIDQTPGRDQAINEHAPNYPAVKLKAFERNQQWAKSGSYQTALNPAQEQDFRAWVKQHHVPFDFSAKHPDYDMRGFWLGLQKGDPIAKQSIDPNDGKMHFPDKWKTPYDPTFSKQSKYATSKAPDWHGDKLVASDGTVLYNDAAQPGAPRSPLESALARARHIVDPEVRDATVQRLKVRFAEQATAQRMHQQQVSNEVWQHVAQGQSVDQLPPALWGQLSGKEKIAVQKYEATLAKGQQPKTDWATYYKLSRQSARSPAEFANENLYKYRNQLGDTEFKELVKRQEAVQKEGPDALKGVATLNQQLSVAHNQMGWTGSSSADKKGLFDRAVYDAVNAEESQTGKKLGYADRQKIIDRMLLQGEVPGKYWGHNDAAYYQAYEQGQTGQFKMTISDNDRTQAVDALKANGVANPTEAQIRAVVRRHYGLQ